MTLVILAASTSACFVADADADLESDEEAFEDDEASGSELRANPAQIAAELRTRWRIPASVLASGARARFAYDGFDRCVGNLLPPASALKANLGVQFRASIASTSRGGPRIEGLNCRAVRGSDRASIHGTGRALDVFVPMVRGDADNGKGDRIASYLISNAAALGVQLVIWDRTIWQVGRGESEYRGDASHRDHIHVELTREADGRL
jgi:hypothetical protein